MCSIAPIIYGQIQSAEDRWELWLDTSMPGVHFEHIRLSGGALASEPAGRLHKEIKNSYLPHEAAALTTSAVITRIWSKIFQVPQGFLRLNSPSNQTNGTLELLIAYLHKPH